jgi:hypothetical protein
LAAALDDLIVFARRRFAGSFDDGRGSMAAHRASFRRQTGKPAPAKDSPPEILAYLFEWFEELSAHRPPGFASAGPISWGEMAAWASMTGRDPHPWEARSIMTLDLLWRAEHDKHSRKNAG